MRVQPRPEILAIWRDVARFSFRDGAFIWAGGPDAGDSVSDGEQLLCILLPATVAASLRIDAPDQTEDDAAEALRAIGDRHSVPHRLVRAMTEYMTRYSDSDGPTFRAGQYMRTTDGNSSTLDVLESFALGVHVSLVALGFCRTYRSNLAREDLIAETHRLEELAAFRLTCAMVGLVRCFTIHGFHDDTPHGENLRHTIAQEHRAEPAVLAEFERALADVRAGLHEVTIGVRAGRLDPEMRFECGWSWAQVTGTAPVEVDGRPAPDRAAAAAALPHPYFSWVALNAVAALYSERTRLLGLLEEDQQRLARALQLRLDLTRAYWSRLATFGDHRWPLERIPWRTTSGAESDHHSLAVAAMTAAELGDRPGNTDVAFSHLTRILARLAHRHKIVRPPTTTSAEGRKPLASQPIPVPFEEPGPPTAYLVTGFAPLLFTAVVQARRATQHEQLRGDLDDIADLVWDHVAGTADVQGTTGLRRFGDTGAPDWHNVLAIVDGLTRAMAFTEGGLMRTQSPLGFVHQLLAAADELVDTLAPNDGAAVTSRLDRARRLADEQPARAAALLYQVLAELDAVTTAGEEP
jgi:hypothetical protein